MRCPLLYVPPLMMNSSRRALCASYSCRCFQKCQPSVRRGASCELELCVRGPLYTLQAGSGTLTSQRFDLALGLQGEGDDLVYQVDAEGEGSGSNPTGEPLQPVLLDSAAGCVADQHHADGFLIVWMDMKAANVKAFRTI